MADSRRYLMGISTALLIVVGVGLVAVVVHLDSWARVTRFAAAADALLKRHTGMGLNEHIDAEVRSLVQAGKTEEAIRFYRDATSLSLGRAKRRVAGLERGL